MFIEKRAIPPTENFMKLMNSRRNFRPRAAKTKPYRAFPAPPFPSLDFPNRDSLNPVEAARRLGCSVQHIYNLVVDGRLRAVNISRPGGGRRFFRIPIESWRKFLTDHCT
jgi:excisionase family DNA binding protein